jgi:uncharacterized membrane protein YeaQ/YmgE (transglycosylase-associated protein family)
MLGLMLFGFIIGLAFSAYYKADTAREIIWNIIFAIVASFQGKLLLSLLIMDGAEIPSLIILFSWVIGFLYLKKLLIGPKNIRYIRPN